MLLNPTVRVFAAFFIRYQCEHLQLYKNEGEKRRPEMRLLFAG